MSISNLCIFWVILASLSVAEASNSDDSGGRSEAQSFLVVSEMTVEEGKDAIANNQKDDSAPAPGSRVAANANRSNSCSAISSDASFDIVAGDSALGASSGSGSDTDTDGEEDDHKEGKLPLGSDEDSSVESLGSHIRDTGECSCSDPPSITGDNDLAFSPSSFSDNSIASQPLRTLKRLQAMLDDTDYATQSIATPTGTTTEAFIDGSSSKTKEGENWGEKHSQASATARDPSERMRPKSSPSDLAIPNTDTNSNAAAPQPTDKLWTSRDRAKYRRTRRSETQRQAEEVHARKARDRQRQRIVQEERERREQLEAERRERERRVARSDDETDTDAGGGFELPNLPVYLSDAETDDASEADTDERPSPPRAPWPPLSNRRVVPPNSQQGGYDVPNVNMGQTNGRTDTQTGQQPYRYDYPAEVQKHENQQPQLQQTTNIPYHDNYQHQYPQYLQQQQQQQQQQPATPQYQQFGQQHSNHAPQLQESQLRQYEQQYAAWAQAAANGYYYPPPPHPSTTAMEAPYPQQQQQQQQQQQHTPQPQQNAQHPASYAHQPPVYAAQQQQQQQQQQNSQGPVFDSFRQQHPYHAQQQPFLPQSQTSFIPQSQIPPPAAATSSSTYQESGRELPRLGLLGRDFTAQQQLHHQDGVPQNSNNEETTPANTNNNNPIPVESSAAVNPMTVSDGESISESFSSTSGTMSSVNGQKSVNSVLTTSPLISHTVPSATTGTRVEAPINDEEPFVEPVNGSDVLIAGTQSKLSFDSVQKLSLSTLGIALLSYCAVSPRSLRFPEYNRLFLQNLSIIWLAAIAPVGLLLAVYDGRYNNINTAIGTFHVSFTLGYALAFLSEVVVTTFIRLGVFKIWEPAVFSLTPEVPSIILPWVLREKQYKPKRITLFAADFGASCVASPIIEEYLKLKVVQWTCKLPRNFKQIKKPKKGTSWRRKYTNALQPVRSIDAPQVVNINCYITQMLAASLGLKLFDVSRRILMYTKDADLHKHIYAVLRGAFPLHELCGTMTALFLARRDVLGVNLPTWKILAPGVFIHAMANFRGMKPIFKWNSSTPWSEMQLSQLKSGDGNGDILRQLLPKTYAKLVWLTILCRVFGFCVKNYYLIRRQALKRTTTYSGKLHAFNAKLQTDAMLKRG